MKGWDIQGYIHQSSRASLMFQLAFVSLAIASLATEIA